MVKRWQEPRSMYKIIFVVVVDFVIFYILKYPFFFGDFLFFLFFYSNRNFLGGVTEEDLAARIVKKCAAEGIDWHTFLEVKSKEEIVAAKKRATAQIAEKKKEDEER